MRYISVHRVTGAVLPAVLALAAALAWGGGVAVAHAQLSSSDPADGSQVTMPPPRITMQFSEDLDPAASTATVSRMDGTRVDNGDAQVDATNRKTLTVGVPALLPGGYIVQWHAVTPDDNGVTEGSFTFTVVAEGGGVATPVTAPPSPAGGTGSISGSSPAMPRTGYAADIGPFALPGAALLGLGLTLVGAWLVRRGRAGAAMHR
jgi:methionine-rich copper-binding protein CopC